MHRARDGAPLDRRAARDELLALYYQPVVRFLVRAIGTPEYMAPEQARGDGAIGPAADIYGLGACLYEVVAEQPPFPIAGRPDSRNSVLVRVLTEPPPRLRAAPAGLDSIVAACLEKDPAARYPGAAALARDLDRHLAGEAPVGPPGARARRLFAILRKIVRAGAAIALVLGIALLARSGAPRTARVGGPRISRLIEVPGLARPFSIACDREDVFVGGGLDGGDRPVIFRAPASGGTGRRLVNLPDYPLGMTVAGGSLVWVCCNSGPGSSTQVFRMPKDGSATPTAIYTGVEGRQPITEGCGVCWDGRWLYALDVARREDRSMIVSRSAGFPMSSNGQRSNPSNSGHEGHADGAGGCGLSSATAFSSSGRIRANSIVTISQRIWRSTS